MNLIKRIISRFTTTPKEIWVWEWESEAERQAFVKYFKFAN